MKIKIFALLLGLGFLSSCGDDDDDEAPAAATTVEFSAVNTILTNRCGGTSCHASGNTVSVNVYVSGEAKLKANKVSVIDRVVTKKDMPPTNATATQKAMTADERTTIQTFLNQ